MLIRDDGADCCDETKRLFILLIEVIHNIPLFTLTPEVLLIEAIDNLLNYLNHPMHHISFIIEQFLDSYIIKYSKIGKYKLY